MDPTTNLPPLPLSAYENGSLTLYHLESSMSVRVLWALEELSLSTGLKYKIKSFSRVIIKGGGTPGILKASPMGLAPALEIHPNSAATSLGTSTTSEVDGKDLNSIILTESRLILEYLSANYANKLWTPETEEERLRDAFYSEYAQTILARSDIVLRFDIIPPNMPLPLRLLFGWLFNYVASIHASALPKLLRVLEKALTEEYPWFSGKKIGVADFMMSFSIDLALQRGYLDVDVYPQIKGWIDRRELMQGWKGALDKVSKYDLVTFQ